MESTGQERTEPISDSKQESERRQQVSFLANAACERVSSRFNLLVAKEIINENSEVGVFLNDAERAAYNSACHHLARLFALTE